MEEESIIKKDEVRYLCDGEDENCKKMICYKNVEGNGMVCRYTSDIRHAKNFQRVHQSYREQEDKKGNGRLEFDIKTGDLMLDRISKLIKEIKKRHPEADIRIRM